MSTKPHVSRGITVAILPTFLAVVGCSGTEQELLDRYFAASERGDNGTVAALSMVAFPEDVVEWNVLEISDAFHDPYRIPAMRDAVREIEDERDAHFRVFGDWRRENLDTLRRIQTRLRDDPDYAFPGRLGEIQAQWDIYRADRRAVVAKLRDAEIELEREIRRANKSLQRESSPEYLTGETLRKEARVRVTTPSGDTHYRVTLSRYELTNQFDALVPARWIITAVAKE